MQTQTHTHMDGMASFSSTCGSKVDRASRLRGEDRQGTHSDSDCSAVLEKTREFFQICDIEGKGFITRRDMQRLNGELPLCAEELENVFDTLDADGNGYLTLEEFSSGFSEFMFGPSVVSVDPHTDEEPVLAKTPEVLYESQWEERNSRGDDDEEQHFCMLMENLGASNIFEEPREVRSLWVQLRRDEPHLLSNFEEFLARVTYQIKEANQEKKEMETALKRKVATHDDEIQRLYEEMEQQIKNEKERILLADSERFLSRSQDMEHQLSAKEKELEMLSNKQKRLERQCRELHSEQQETAVENVKLKKCNEDLSRELDNTTQELSLAQEQLMLLQEMSSRLHEEREMEIYRVTESLQRERASLLKQLDLLREMNKHLRDERDMCYQKPNTSVAKLSWKQRPGSITLKQSERKHSFKSDEDEEVLPQSKWKNVIGVNGHSMDLEDMVDGRPPSEQQLRKIISIEEDHLPQVLQQGYQAHLRDWSKELEEGMDVRMSNVYPTTSTPNPVSPPPGVAPTPNSPRGRPVGKETVQSVEEACSGPDRLFKIILVGNSSVGKTSLLRRFCDNCFHSGTCATVGIDYSVKILTVDNSQVALQMWDTAGQERYRSITKQFFRKADGVVVVYDITNEQTFTAVRHWLTSVQEGAGEDIPIMLLGNKTDLDGQREVPLGVAEKLAKDFQLIFYECSAFSSNNVTESMIHMASGLQS
ncbi:ras and EF-hand domain-containing protein homolog isoform X2 [Carassius auratus]|uniref:Ras and EF-hand domain-containing protein homolog isoform X2 n=1 Tax=Carassius auratus TaxID=7957 RepID=A0A6P6RB85_CARAU|nr:ras and EF-hand domain-containing protein homolog isoform X2 [Carassius auratus]